MLYKEGLPWQTCIDAHDMSELRKIVSMPGFDFAQLVDVDLFDKWSEIPFTRGMTPLGYALHMRNASAFDVLLASGANPDAVYMRYPKTHPFAYHTVRVLEGCVSIACPRHFVEKLLQYGASTVFRRPILGANFMEDLHGWSPDRVSLIREAHDRELRAYTVVWCANHAGGSWPDMAMLLQAMVMRDELICEVSTPLSKRREK